MVHGVYDGIGRSIGSILAGKLQGQLGTALMFKYFATWNLALTLALLAYNEVSVHKKSKASQNEASLKKKIA